MELVKATMICTSYKIGFLFFFPFPVVLFWLISKSALTSAKKKFVLLD